MVIKHFVCILLTRYYLWYFHDEKSSRLQGVDIGILDLFEKKKRSFSDGDKRFTIVKFGYSTLNDMWLKSQLIIYQLHFDYEFNFTIILSVQPKKLPFPMDVRK